MNKFLKYILWMAGAFVGLVILLLAAAAIIIPIKYPPEKLKAMASEKLTETLHHKVTIGDVRFNILNGFKITGLKMANRAGWDPTPLVDAKVISISYDLFPLLWGQVSLGEVSLDRPEIYIERRGMNEFNFSDMTGDAPAAPAPQAAPKVQPKAATKAKPKAKSKAKPKPKKKTKTHAALPAVAPPDVLASLFVGRQAVQDRPFGLGGECQDRPWQDDLRRPLGEPAEKIPLERPEPPYQGHLDGGGEVQLHLEHARGGGRPEIPILPEGFLPVLDGQFHAQGYGHRGLGQ
jgi:hypothetical protein